MYLQFVSKFLQDTLFAHVFMMFVFNTFCFSQIFNSARLQKTVVINYTYMVQFLNYFLVTCISWLPP